ncbi:hypothetical protein [Frankia sp. CiP3]|uniref:hypothetical protein n=1 Tax=Frankia sp. CiP3 TaxID=2880971 RepID=UPI0027DFF730|nr:hypothetical protein [Frankia sp. CiP3]
MPVATTAADLAEPDQHLDATLLRWLPLTSSSTGRLGLGQLAALWPLRTNTQRRGNGAFTRLERPDRLHLPQPMPPAGPDPHQRAA